MSYLFRHQESLDSFERSIPGFISQRKAYNDIDTDEERAVIASNPMDNPYRTFITLQEDAEGELEAVRVVGPVRLASLVNHLGLIGIGANVYKYTQSHTLSSGKQDAASVSQMIAWDGGLPPAGMTLHAIEYGTLPVKDPRESSLLQQCTQSYNIGSKVFRVKGSVKFSSVTETYTDFSGLTYNVTTRTYFAQTEHSARKFGIWWNDKGDLTLTATGTVTWTPSLSATINVNASASNDSNLERDLASSDDDSITSTSYSATYTVTHTAGQNGQSRTCTNTQ